MSERVVYQQVVVTEYVSPYVCSVCGQRRDVKVTTYKGKEFKHNCPCQYKSRQAMWEKRNYRSVIARVLVFGVWGLYNRINLKLWWGFLFIRMVYFLVDNGWGRSLSPAIFDGMYKVIGLEKYLVSLLMEAAGVELGGLKLIVNIIFVPVFLQVVCLISGIVSTQRYNSEVEKKNEETERYNQEAAEYNQRVREQEEKELEKFKERADAL